MTRRRRSAFASLALVTALVAIPVIGSLSAPEPAHAVKPDKPPGQAKSSPKPPKTKEPAPTPTPTPTRAPRPTAKPDPDPKPRSTPGPVVAPAPTPTTPEQTTNPTQPPALVSPGASGDDLAAASSASSGQPGPDVASVVMLIVLAGLPFLGIGLFLASRKRPEAGPEPRESPRAGSPAGGTTPAGDVPRLAVPAVLATGDPLLLALGADRRGPQARSLRRPAVRPDSGA